MRTAHEWFERHSGWAPPDEDTLAEWLADGTCRCPDDCLVAPASACEHGLASWWLILCSLDGATRSDPLEAKRILPHPDRLSPAHPDYVTLVGLHHRVVAEGAPGYMDPTTGLFVMTARALWDRGFCCEQGCRHCPYIERQ